MTAVRGFIAAHPEISGYPVVVQFCDRKEYPHVIEEIDDRHQRILTRHADHQFVRNLSIKLSGESDFSSYGPGSIIRIFLDDSWCDPIHISRYVWHEMEHHLQHVTGALKISEKGHWLWHNEFVANSKDIAANFELYETLPWEIAARKKEDSGEEWFLNICADPPKRTWWRQFGQFLNEIDIRREREA
jgi:hypothetical protein